MPRHAHEPHDPNARRMVALPVCYKCFSGLHEACIFYGASPFPVPRRAFSRPPVADIEAQCMCARMKHPKEMVMAGQSSAIYDVHGNQVP